MWGQVGSYKKVSITNGQGFGHQSLSEVRSGGVYKLRTVVYRPNWRSAYHLMVGEGAPAIPSGLSNAFQTAQSTVPSTVGTQ